MTGLPEYTIVTSEKFPIEDGGTYPGPKRLVKEGGMWWDQEGYAYASTDDELWSSRPDAVVVALPTFNQMTRDQAEKLWAMKVRARTCARQERTT